MVQPVRKSHSKYCDRYSIRALESAAVQALQDKVSEKLDEVTDKVLEGIFGSDKEPE